MTDSHRLFWRPRDADLSLASARLDAAARCFFALSPARKAMASITLPDGNRMGWCEDDHVGQVRAERFQYRARCSMFPWPDDCGTGCTGEEFRAAVLGFYHAARCILVGELEAYQEEGNIAQSHAEHNAYGALFLSYRSADGGELTPRQRSSGHTDHGMLTLLSLGAIDGDGKWRRNAAPLQIYNRTAGTWSQLMEGGDGGGGGDDIGFVVMAGEQLAAATSGAVPACVHRVGGGVAPPVAGAGNVDRARFSMSLQLRARWRGDGVDLAGAEAEPRPHSSLRPIALHFL